MALVKKFDVGSRTNRRVHGIVNAEIIAFSDSEGKRYVQIDTFGAESRKLKGKTSQCIQLDKTAAEQLISVLKAEFPGL